MKIFLIATLFVIITTTSCKKESEEAQGIDRELLQLAQSTDGYTWYKFSDENLPRSSGSGHNFTFLRTRFNGIAANKLDSLGKIREGITFDEGSVIVKELINGSGGLDRYAVLKKETDSQYADENGWVWGYINSDGSVAETATNRGAACTGCHLQEGNIDYMLMNKFFP